MALVDTKDKTVNQSVMTTYHKYFFGHSEKPKVLDLFGVQDIKPLKSIYGTSIVRTINKKRVHYGFYKALRDFIRRHDIVLVKLTKEEEDFFKETDPEIYKLYKEYHKGKLFYHEELEKKKSKEKQKKAVKK